MIATVTTNGQITIPDEIRKKFNISAKDRVDLIADGDLPENFLAELLLLMHVYV